MFEEEAVDFNDIDCEDCGHKFLVGDSYDYTRPMANKCGKCRRAAIEFEQWAAAEQEKVAQIPEQCEEDSYFYDSDTERLCLERDGSL